MTVLHAKGGPAEEKQEEGRPAQPLLHRGIWTRPSVRYLLSLPIQSLLHSIVLFRISSTTEYLRVNCNCLMSSLGSCLICRSR